MISPAQRRVGLLVAGCMFMEILDGTIVSTSAPKIAAALHKPSASIGLVITAYLVTLAVLIPLSAWLVGRFGTRRVFLLAIVVFTVSSLMCGLSTSLVELVLWRVVQGIGGAMMVPVGRLAVLGPVDKADLLRMIAYIVWPALMAPVIAPLAGGLITTYGSWHWLFFINVPLGVVAFALTLRIFTPGRAPAPPPLDVLGVVLTCLGLGGLTYAASLVAQPTLHWGLIAAVALPASALLGGTVRHLLVTDHPLIHLGALRTSTFRVSVGSGSLAGMAIQAVPFLLPLLFQNVFGWSAVTSGSLVLFVFLGNIGAKTTTTFLMSRFGFRRVLIVVCPVLAAAIAGFGFFTDTTPIVVIVIVSIISGAARSVGGTAYNTLAFCDIPEKEMPHANGLSATAQQLAGGIGVAFATVALRVGQPLGALVTGHAAASSTYAAAFVIVALLPLGALVGVCTLAPNAGDGARVKRTAIATASAAEAGAG